MGPSNAAARMSLEMVVLCRVHLWTALANGVLARIVLTAMPSTTNVPLRRLSGSSEKLRVAMQILVRQKMEKNDIFQNAVQSTRLANCPLRIMGPEIASDFGVLPLAKLIAKLAGLSL
jgi:hypothetical protein